MRCGDETIEKEIEQNINKIISEMKAIKPTNEMKIENLEVN